MDIYSIFLVIIWITILVVCKKAILDRIKKLFKFKEENIIYNQSDLLQNIEHEYHDIQSILNTEVLSIKDELRFKKLTDNFQIKEDIIIAEDIDNIEDGIDMNKILTKTGVILKQFISNFFIRITNYFKN